MMEEIEKMSSLISRILRKEYADEPDTPAVLRRVCLSDILQELVPKYENWLKVHGIHFEADITPDVYVMGDTDLIEQAVHNYIMNAFGHTRQGKKIILTLRSGDKECVLGVYNDGSGIAEAEKERIWERGYRSGTEKTFGSGLGLYIVRQIALTHQGSCGTVNEKAGVLFWIKLFDLQLYTQCFSENFKQVGENKSRQSSHDSVFDGLHRDQKACRFFSQSSQDFYTDEIEHGPCAVYKQEGEQISFSCFFFLLSGCLNQHADRGSHKQSDKG